MSWITVISYEKSFGKLRRLYDRIKGPNNQIDNILKAHSLRPHTLQGHMHLYKNVLHHQDNTLPKWFLETLGIYVSLLNKCDYCVDHHSAGLAKLVDQAIYQSIVKSLSTEELTPFKPHEKEALFYARILTSNPYYLKREHMENLIKNGFSEGEILEINQVVAYFNYANRTVLGLGITTEGDVLGMSPSSEQQDQWGHE